MSNRYLTHLGTILLLHILVLIGSFQLIQEPRLSKPLSFGPSGLKLRLATQAILQHTLPPKVAMPEKKIATQPKVKEVVSAPVPSTAVSETLSPLARAATADQKAIFKAELRAEIEKNKSYPPMSRRLGQTGTVVVAFTLLEDGHIIDVRLDTPSRFERLNESAIEAVKSVHKFKPIPKEWGQAKMDFTVPVNYLNI